MKRLWTVILFFICITELAGQVEKPDGFTQFFYPNGQISAEGIIRDNKPDGYWKNYYEDGTLKSEGNRLFFELDSIWKFYYPDGKISSEINYRQDKKNGYSTNYDFYYNKDSSKTYYLASKELFLNSKREGLSYYYDSTGYIKYCYSYKNDKKQGDGKEFDSAGQIITLFSFYNGYLVESIKINRTDKNKLKQGKWIDFYSNGNKQTESHYFNGKLHGLYREYDATGKLKKELKYVDGEIYIPKPEDEIVIKAEIKKSYFPNGKIQYEGAFLENTPVGIHKEYDAQGKVIDLKEYSSEGNLYGTGFFDENGNRTGLWKLYDRFFDYYYAEGNFKNGLQVDKWIYYYPNGKIEQEGYYIDGKADKDWVWYYPNGMTKLEEIYISGKHEGNYVEYDSTGNIILSGKYFDDAKDEEWFYNVGDIIEKGKYKLGEKTEIWKHYYNETDELRFVGAYKNGDPDGVHKWYYPDGKIELTGSYRMGKKQKNWKKFNEDGKLYMTFTYRNDELIKIDGISLKKGKGNKK
ncbi:MAG: hypothetical protein PHH30_05605 [Bacteroidales bacterium]|nr:hypothetical protein [Bacteroidales bacterium]